MTPGANGGGRPAKQAAEALRGSIGPLMRQIRKYSALQAFVAALPVELAELAAPYDVKLAPLVQQAPAGMEAGSGAEGAGGEVNTLYVYAASATVGTLIEQQARPLIAAVNAALPYPMVEALRVTVAAPQKIARQLNILSARPD